METKTENKPTKFWGDEEEENERHEDYETGPDENGIKTIVQFKVNEKGQKVKITKKVKVIKKLHQINKKVEERKKWKKFGDCVGLPPGPERGITTIGEEVGLDLSGRKKDDKTENKDTTTPLVITCRVCAGNHWTLKCPYKDRLESVAGGRDSEKERGGAGGAAAAAGGGAGGAGGSKYVPPSLRSRTDGGTGPAGDSMRKRDETATIRVTNLSEETKENDLSELFRPFGQVSRIYLAKDKHSGKSKGFAFINFVHKDDAARAIEKLSGYGYDHLILHLEWAKPSER